MYKRQSLYNSVAELAQHYPELFAVVDGCSNFVFIKSPVSKQLFDYLLSQGTAIRYMGDYIRITAGTDDENKTLISQMNDFCRSLKD